MPKEFVDAINTPLKTLVDFGYSRNDDKLFGVKPATNVVTDSVRFAPSSADAKTASDSDTATFGSRKPLTNVVTESVKFAPGSADDRNATAARSSGSVTSSDGKPATDVVTESPNFNSVSGPKSAGAEGRTAAGSSSAESPEQQSVSASASP